MGPSISIVDYSPVDRQFNQNGVNTLTIGAGSYIAEASLDFASIDSSHLLIGRYSSLAFRLVFSIGENHNYHYVTTYPFRQREIKNKIALRRNWTDKNFYTEANHYQILIGNDVWVGANVKILGGVKIGSGAVIGANTIVTKDIPPYSVVVGNSSRIIKYRFSDDIIQKLLAIKWWNWSTEKIWKNVELLEQPEKFIDKFYSTKLENFKENDISKELKEFRQNGGLVYTFIADFRAQKPLWYKVIRDFLTTFKHDDQVKLIFWTGENSVRQDIDEFHKFMNAIAKEKASEIIVISSTTQEIFSPSILRQSDYFISTRDIICLQCMDYLYDTDVKIISSLDEVIFTRKKILGGGVLYCKCLIYQHFFCINSIYNINATFSIQKEVA